MSLDSVNKALAGADRLETGGGGGPRKPRTRDVLRGRFVAGLITIIPIGVTIWAVLLLVSLVDRIFGPFVDQLVKQLVLNFSGIDLQREPEAAPTVATLVNVFSLFFSLGFAILFILAIGILTRFLFVRRMINLGEGLLTRVPLLRFFYLTPKEVIAVLTTKRQSIKRVVMIEYPRKGMWCLAYATGEIIHRPSGEVLVTVFLPTTPNPTSGYLLLVPISEVHDVNMGTEEAVRLIISGGILAPNTISSAPFSGLHIRPDLPPPEPLTADIPPELLERAGEEEE